MNFNKMLASLSKAKMMKGSGNEVLNTSNAMGIAKTLLSKKGKSRSGSAKMGTMAVVGGIAWKAYKSYTDKQARDRAYNQGKYAYEGEDLLKAREFDYGSSNVAEERFEEFVDDKNELGQMLLLRAMVAAANADGHIDTSERMKIFAQVEKFDLDAHDKASLFDEMKNPWSIEKIVAEVPCSEAASEVYAVSALALDIHQTESRLYLNKLAAMLCIPNELQHHLEQTIEQSRISVSV